MSGSSTAPTVYNTFRYIGDEHHTSSDQDEQVPECLCLPHHLSSEVPLGLYACSISRSFVPAHVAKVHKHLQVLGHGGKHSPPAPKCQRQRRARTLSPPPPYIVEQAGASLLDQSELRAGSRHKGAHTPASARPRRQAVTLHPPPSARGRDEHAP